MWDVVNDALIIDLEIVLKKRQVVQTTVDTDFLPIFLPHLFVSESWELP